MHIAICTCMHSSEIGRRTCLATERFKKSIGGLWPKKAVHNWSNSMLALRTDLKIYLRVTHTYRPNVSGVNLDFASRSIL